MVKKLLPSIIAVSLLLVALIGWRQMRNAAAEPVPPAPVPVVAKKVEPQPVPAFLEAVGSLQAVRQVMLAPETPGRVVAIRFEAGSQVRSGELLVQLDDAPERADRAAAKARADFARIQLERSKELAPSGAESRSILEQRQAEHDQAVAAVRQLDARIAQKAVRAPFSGEIGIRRINPGQYLNAGEPVASLVDLDRLYVNFNVPQQELAKLREGQSVRVITDAWPDRVFTAKVNAVEPMVSNDTRNVSVQAIIDNKDRALRPGMYVTAQLELPAEKNAIVVPATALQTSASGDSVMVVKNGAAAVVPVRAGRRVGEAVVIARGLQPGDTVITEGQLRLQPGAKVSIAADKKEG